MLKRSVPVSTSLTFGIAIPTYIKHIDYLDALLDSINSSTSLPDHVVVSVSSYSDREINLKKYHFPLTLIITESYQNPSKNRNIAAKMLETDIISFVDGDDAVHPRRTEILKSVFERHRKVVCHNYIRLPTLDYIDIHTISDPVIHYDYINISHPSLAFPVSSHGHRDYHCAHVSLTRELFSQYLYDESEALKYREDADLLNRLVRAGIYIDYIPEALSFYRK